MQRFSLIFLLVVASVVGYEVPQYLKARYKNLNNEVVTASPPSQSAAKVPVKTKTKTAVKTGPGPSAAPVHPSSKYKGGCTTEPPKPLNAGVLCSIYSGCRATCVAQHQFPNGETHLFITCDNGQWTIEGKIWEDQHVPPCQPICLPTCQNGGICTAPNQCQCSETFSGPYCQFENKPCMSYPQLPTNSRRSCSSKFCTVSCNAGHQFPDGSAIATVSCKNGFWLPDKEKWISLPDCQPVCKPPCQNGGNCLSFGRCQCPQDFRGPQCQYSTENCAAKNLQFNGGYNCTGDLMGLTCSIYCPEGMEFEFKPSLTYECLYEEGRFIPSPVPQCIFSQPRPAALKIGPTHHFYHVNTSGFNLNSLAVNELPELSYIPPGQRWNNYPHFGDPDEIVFVTVNPYSDSNNLGFVQEKLPQPGVCFSWQGTHYKTFDGRVFSFDSKCAHTLIKDAADNTFSVVVRNDRKCNTEPSSCYRIIEIFYDKKEYILKRSDEGVPIFATPKKRLPIPGQLPGLRIEMSAHYIILSLDTVGAKLKWDGQQLVQVEVQESLWNRTEGLCGNIDGDDSNDIFTKDGHKSRTISNLATSWKVEDLEEECNDLPREQHACQDDGVDASRSHRATQFCKKLLNDPRFAPCAQVVDVSLLLDACRWDYCSCSKQDPSLCPCETMNVYVRTCSYKGVKNLVTWRDEKICPMQCTGGRIYRACGPAAGQAVCGSSTEREEDEEGCAEGCYCPEGTVLHEDRCITRDKCPCRLRAKDFPPGAEVPKECNTCTCSEGKWVCTQVSCGARCAAIGDPHYITFDGKRFDFMGQCSYYLVKTPTFSIEAENVACAGSISQAMNLPAAVSSGLPSCTKAVTLKIHGQVIKLKQNHDVVVNGQDVTKVPYHIANVTIRSVSSIFLQVELPNGMRIWWDGVTRAYIDIPANFKEKTKGLCGTFNYNQKDDFLTPEDDTEQSVIPFANKWKTSEKCSDIPDVIKSHPCSANMHNQPTAEKHCQKIKSDLFADCHWTVDPEPFYQDCLYDMCSCEYKISQCLCPTVAAYAEECSRKGVKVSWRDSVRDCGIHCPRGQKYQICGNSCSRTCFDVATRPDCRPQCVEGCNCPDGEALNDEGECVPIGECRCHYDGLQFHSGYKEVRPASKGPELCTCVNALWTCRLATKDEQKKYPKADDLKSLCGAKRNMEFTTCEPAEPVTCRNMHNPEYFSASVCHAGCKCKDGHVLDTSTGHCVKPVECPCHHGGKSYKENSTVQNDCNTCQCQNGKWKCTDRPCAAECSAWGDSHLKTFDGKHYDFQGQCDYVLAKGASGSDSFDVTIQNVPCGSLGTSCSKSLTIRVKSGEDQDVVALTSGKSLPDHSSLKHVTVRAKELFVILEAPDLGAVVQWDRGTRVYVKVDPRWKGRIQGLCGNYNDNDADDFQTPSGGITEASAKIFGDSWKLQSYCPEAQEISNTCEDRPDRRVWALKQCGVLKSPLFAPCHSEVPVDIYLEKCIFDACACDQGGDCECLCTALAAYAQECNTRGVPIKWRSQKLCPMQCDERCSSYSPCVSTCPTETCDNLLTLGKVSKLCKEDACVEGCAPKPCPADHVFLNSSFLDCVPRNICKPVCLEIDGVTYYEGDLLEEDDCHRCYCSHEEKVCKGKPCTTTSVTTVATTLQQEQLVKCESGWSEWINQDQAKTVKAKTGKKKTDVEPLPTPLILNNRKGGKCDKEKMVDVECRTVKTHLTPKRTGLDVECSLERGLVCKSTSKGCPDFEIRVLCACEKPTTAAPVCDTVTPHKEHPTDCYKFYHCKEGPSGPEFVEKTCGPYMYYNPVSMVCDWPYAVEEIKPECKAPTPTTQVATTEGKEEEVPLESSVELEVEHKPSCPPGTRKESCAIQCDRLCLYYSHMVKENGFCPNNAKCQDGCVTHDQEPTCPEGKMWLNNDTCVSLSDCLCRSNDGKPIKPGVVYRESDCRVCQCIDNYYACDESACVTTVEPSAVKKTEHLEESGGGSGAAWEDISGVEMRPEVVFITTTAEPQEGDSGDLGGEGELKHTTKKRPPPVLSTVTPPEKCEENRFVDLIQGDQPLSDEAFKATSVLSPDFKPSFSRFNSKSSWVPQYSNNLQYLEINLGRQEPLYGVKVKGSPLYDEYVTSYKISYSPDGTGRFVPVFNKERLPQVFRGSIDANTPIRQIFYTPFEAQKVRIHPETWHTGIALQVELIGCGEPLSTTVPYEFITVHPSTTETPLLCDDPMGLDDGTISEGQISVSSEADKDRSRASLKLSDDSAWQPLTNSPTEFIQFDFLGPRTLTGLETEGGPQGWVTAFTVKYSQDDKEWNPVLEKKTSKERIFLGNFDSDSPQVNRFELPINARYVKLIPTKWHDNIQMRVEVHGCFLPYPTIPEELTTALPSECNYCPGVTAEPLELEACRCSQDKWWDGENCVARTECPCLVGHISYAVGTSYKKEDCSECLCKIGGVSHCSPKQCDSCEKGLRSAVTATCKCTCQPCPDGTILCPSSNVCINSTSWCDGIQDCPDDETNCPTTAIPTTAVTEKPKKCPQVDCPKGYTKRPKRESKARKYHSHLSSLFSNYGRKSTGSAYTPAGYKNPGVKNSYRKTPLQRPLLNVTATRQNEEVCVEYECVSSKPPPKYIHSMKECPPANCPLGYVAVFDGDDYTYKECPKYSCAPEAAPDAVCNVTGRTFNTFDGTEYKYDICDHILARDLENDEWEIDLNKNCKETCSRDLIIHHQDSVIVLHPDLTIEYDGFRYTADQAKKIGSRAQSFAISRLGNTFLFVSNRYGFWVIWDKEGNVKLGATRKLVDKIDGLCGYFNENPSDDKKKPDGTPSRTTIDFGDSWAHADGTQCETKTCPIHVQNKAWAICQVKQQVLEPCTRVVNKDAFVSRCVETTCDCLQAAPNRTAEERCRCDALETFVVDCLTTQPTTDVSDWRTQLDCPATCDAPLVYHDCYQRKCEPTCETLRDSSACPKLPSVCFPGCYCPSGYVKKGNACVMPSSCGDCECNVLPHLQYATYDDSNFTVNGNCVYVMSRDVLEGNKEHKFQVLITNAPCKNNEKKTCVGKVTIIYQGRKIHILNDLLRSKLKLIVNGEKIVDFEDVSSWAKVKETPTKHYKILLLDTQVEVSVYYPSLGVSVKSPSHKYGGKLEGLCGDCNNDPRDDFRTNKGELTEDTEEFALSWLYDKLPGGQSKETCLTKPEECPPLPQESDPCSQILDYKTFGQCLRILDPTLFLDWCQKDTCDDHPELACASIEAYARDCANAGFCADWRTKICPAQACPPDQIFSACGTGCPKTCQSIKEKDNSCAKMAKEGCFCPDGQVLQNGTCVDPKDCEVCDDEGHHPGDTWRKDKCTSCTCEGTSLKCETERCSGAEQICERGYQAVKVPRKGEECCDKYACLPEPTAGPTCETPQVITCASDQITKLSTRSNGCQQFICECKPAEQCDRIDATSTDTPLEDGYVRTIDESGCCSQLSTVCKKELCPKPKPCQQYHTLNTTDTGKCCPLHICEPPKHKCIYDVEFTSAQTGGERPRTENEKQKVLKNANDGWKDGPCRQCKCLETNLGNYEAKCTQTDCSNIEISQDYLDYELEPEFVYDQCCPNVKRVACKHNQKIYKVDEKWTKGNDHCTIYECVNGTSGVRKEPKVTRCDSSCDLGFEYVAADAESKQCCGSCKPYACVVGGLVHNVGDTWQSDDYCTNYKCSNFNGSMQVQAVEVSCPEFPNDNFENYVVETKSKQGECCKEHTIVACKAHGKVYQVGETWPSLADQCKKYGCVKKHGEIAIQESVETCNSNCSKGWQYEESKQACCGRCVQVACVVNDQLKKPEESWASSDGCTSYNCEHLGDEFIVSSSQESCPSVENCPEENIYVKGCCKHCNITSLPQTECTSEAISLNKTVGIIKMYREGHGACINKHPVESFTECVGTCHSSTTFNAGKGVHENECSCCQATGFTPLEIELTCEDDYRWKKKVAVPSKCSCEGCASSVKA